MTRHIKTIILVIVLVNPLIGCLFPDSKPKQEYEYIPMKQYKYKKAIIEPGTEVQLLAFSGGKENDKEHIYYYQFIVLNKSTGDTLSILTPLISIDVEAGAETKTYSTPLQYDLSKGVTTAFYELKDSSLNLTLQVNSLVSEQGFDTSTNLKPYMDNMLLNEFVVWNRTLPIFNRNYKTAIGTLNFKKIPW